MHANMCSTPVRVSHRESQECATRLNDYPESRPTDLSDEIF